MSRRNSNGLTTSFFGRTIKRSTGNNILMVSAATIAIVIMAAAAIFGDKDSRGDNMAVFYFGRLYGDCRANELVSMPTVSCEVLPATPSPGIHILEASDDQLYYRKITYNSCGIERGPGKTNRLTCVRL